MPPIHLDADGLLTFAGVTMRFTAHVTGEVTETITQFVLEPETLHVTPTSPGAFTAVGIGQFGGRFPGVVDSVDSLPAPFTATFSGDQITVTLTPTAPGTFAAEITGEAH